MLTLGLIGIVKSLIALGLWLLTRLVDFKAF
jgi:hypothetical protein